MFASVNKDEKVPGAFSRGKLIIPTLVHVTLSMWHLRRNIKGGG